MKFSNIKALLSVVAFGMIAKAATIPTLNEKECKKTFKLVQKCVLLVDEENNGRHACEVFETAECKQLFENIDEELSKCTYEEDMVTADYIKNFVKQSKTYCVKDEQGQFCPLASFITGKDLSVYEVDTTKDDVAILTDIYTLNCVSEKCREATINFLEAEKENLKNIYLNSNGSNNDLVAEMNNLENMKISLMTNDCRNGKTLATLKKEYTAPKPARRRKCIVKKN